MVNIIGVVGDVRGALIKWIFVYVIFLVFAFMLMFFFGIMYGLFVTIITQVFPLSKTMIGDFSSFMKEVYSIFLFFFLSPIGIMILISSIYLNPTLSLIADFITFIIGIINASQKIVVFPTLSFTDINTTSWLKDYDTGVTTLKTLLINF